MENIEMAYHILYVTVLVAVGVGLLLALLRTILGPRTADRILGVNMAGTMTVIAIALLAYILELRDLIDVCLVYCLGSFLSVVVLTKIYVTAHQEKQKKPGAQPGAERRETPRKTGGGADADL